MAIEDWVEQNIDSHVKYTGNQKELHVCCPICNETRYRMYINRLSGKVYCHNCGFKTNLLGLIQHIEGVSFTKAKELFKDIQGNLYLPEDISKRLSDQILFERVTLNKRPIPLPDEYIELNPSITKGFVKQAVNYLHKRKITDNQIISHKFGYCLTGEYKGRIIIPITENGDLKFWVARAISKEVRLKEKSPSNEDYQISKSEVLFNIDVAVRKYNAVVLSEGIFDALSWGDIGVAMLGKTLYQEQLNILLDYRELINIIYIAVDWDARDKATQIAEQLQEYFEVAIINIPQEFDDPNNYLINHNRKDMWKLINSAEPFGEFSGLKRRLL